MFLSNLFLSISLIEMYPFKRAPFVLTQRPLKMLSNVVLPDPDGPIIAHNVPAFASPDTLCKIVLSIFGPPHFFLDFGSLTLTVYSILLHLIETGVRL